MKKMDSVVLISGGIDSTTVLHYVVKELKHQTYGLSILYGQRHDKEIQCAKWQCDLLKVPYEIIDMSFLTKHLSSSSLIKGSDKEVPHIREVLGDPQPSTYVPNRNMMFLSLAAAFAENVGAKEVFYGAQKHDLYCLDSNSWVITKDFKPVRLSELKECQEIIDMNGNTTIIEKIDKIRIPVYIEIKASGAVYRCSLKHEVPIVKYDIRSWDRTWQNHRIQWIPAEKLSPGMFTVMPLKIDNYSNKNVLEPELELKLWWVTEGYMSDDHIDIAQSPIKNTENYERICSLVEACGFKPWRCKEVVSISRKAKSLFEGLGYNSFTKRLPKEVLTLSPEGSLAALDVLIKGDGTYNDRGAYYYTTSEELAQDIIVLALRAGIPAKPQKREGKTIDIHIPPLKTKIKRPRSFGDYQSVKIDSVNVIPEELEVVKLKTSTGTYLGGNIGFLGQSNGYWDTTIEFLDRINHVLTLNRKTQIQIKAPLVDFTKAQVIQKGLELGVDYSHTWSCYTGEEKPSRFSATSAERLKAFVELGLEDPLEYAD